MTRLDSARAIAVLAEHDAAYLELTRALYGGDVAPTVVWADVFGKSSPTAADVHIPGVAQRRDRRNRAITAGLNAVGAAAGTAGVAVGVNNLRRARRVAAGIPPREPRIAVPPKLLKAGRRGFVALELAGLGGELASTRILHGDVKRATPQPIPQPIIKAGITELAEGYAHQARQLVRRLVPAGTGRHRAPFTGGPAKTRTAPGAAGSSKSPAGSAKPSPGQHTLFDIGGKPSPEGATVGSQRGQEAGFRIGQAAKTATATPGRKAAVAGGTAVAAAAGAHHHAAGQQPADYPGPSAYYYSKRSERETEVEWAGTFSKLDADKRLAFGWASMSKVDGMPVVDRQDDVILTEDIEDAVYHYVQHSRVGGDMHRRVPGLFGKYARPGLGLWEQSGTDQPHKVADLVESMVFTDEKVEKMGLPESFPRGWWVGFRYHDDDAWADIKEGRKTGFSIHGKGLREPIDLDDLMYGAVA